MVFFFQTRKYLSLFALVSFHLILFVLALKFQRLNTKKFEALFFLYSNVLFYAPGVLQLFEFLKEPSSSYPFKESFFSVCSEVLRIIRRRILVAGLIGSLQL